MFRSIFALAIFAAISGPAVAQNQAQGTPSTPTPAAPPVAQAPAAPPAPAWPEKGATKTGEAIAWDGDTIEIEGQAIRLFGIDAPEMRGDPRGPVARGALDDLLAPDPTATCEALTVDRYKRPVARCRAGGRDLAEAMVLGGWAFSHRKYSTDYDAAEAEARAEGSGFWKGQLHNRQKRWAILFDNTFDLIAIYAAFVATMVLFWDVIKWRRSGARLRVTAGANMIILNDPDPRREGKTFVFIEVVNVGSGPTTITSLNGCVFKNWIDYIRFKADTAFFVTAPEAAQHLPLPHVLAAGERWTGIIEQTDEVVHWAQSSLLYALVYHSVGRKPIRVRITVKAKDEHPDEKATPES